MPVTATLNGQTRRLTHREEIRWEVARGLLHTAALQAHRAGDKAQWGEILDRRRELRLGDLVETERCIQEFSRPAGPRTEAAACGG